MTDVFRISPEVRAALGLAEDAVFLHHEGAPWPEGQPQGSIREAAVVVGAAFATALGPPHQVELPLFATRGYYVAVHDVHDGSIEVIDSGTRSIAHRAFSESGQPLKVDVERGEGGTLVRARLPEGSYLELGELARTNIIRVTKAGPEVVVAEIVVVGSPVSAMATAVQDPWLASELKERASDGNEWYQAVAVGLAGRLSSASDRWADHDAEAVAGPIYQWLEGLTLVQANHLSDLALVKAARLHEQLDELLIEFRPGLPEWQSELRDVSHLREELEEVAGLLNVFENGSRVRAALDQVDDLVLGEDGYGLSVLAFRDLAAAFPPANDLSDTLLLRVARVDPFAWWAPSEPTSDLLDSMQGD